jgi:hypothetical protein
MVRVSWLLSSLSCGRIELLLPRYAMCLTARSRARLSRISDPFGDLYLEDASEQSLKEAIQEATRSDSFQPIEVHNAQGRAVLPVELLDLLES